MDRQELLDKLSAIKPALAETDQVQILIPAGTYEHLGVFDTIKQAALARKAAKKRLGYSKFHGWRRSV